MSNLAALATRCTQRKRWAKAKLRSERRAVRKQAA